MNYLCNLSFCNVYTHGKVVLNLFFGMFSVSFPTSHGYFSPYNNVCKKIYDIDYNKYNTEFLVIGTIADVMHHDNVTLFELAF